MCVLHSVTLFRRRAGERMNKVAVLLFGMVLILLLPTLIAQSLDSPPALFPGMNGAAKCTPGVPILMATANSTNAMNSFGDRPPSGTVEVISSLGPAQALVRFAQLRSQRAQLIAEIEKIRPDIAPKGMFETTEEYKARRGQAEERVREATKPLRASTELLDKAIISLGRSFFINSSKSTKFIGYDADWKEMRVSLDGSEFVSRIPRDIAQRMHQEWSAVLVAQNGWSLDGVGVGCNSAPDQSLELNGKNAIVWNSQPFVLEPYNRVYRVGGDVSAPSVLLRVEPEYSEEARAKKRQGTVVLYSEVDESGKPKNLRVVQALGSGLDEEAIKAVSRWKFRPSYKAGRPVTVAVTLEVHFRLL